MGMRGEAGQPAGLDFCIAGQQDDVMVLGRLDAEGGGSGVAEAAAVADQMDMAVICLLPQPRAQRGFPRIVVHDSQAGERERSVGENGTDATGRGLEIALDHDDDIGEHAARGW